jgi:hypothetical protein
MLRSYYGESDKDADAGLQLLSRPHTIIGSRPVIVVLFVQVVKAWNVLCTCNVDFMQSPDIEARIKNRDKLKLS